MAKMKTLHDLFIDQLKDMHSAERQLTAALPKMAKAATAPELKRAFEQHLELTKAQIERLTQIFDMMGASQGRKKCKGMEGLIAEGEELLSEEGVAPAVLDAGLIAAAQKVEHYEIASYGTLRSYADMMGHSRASRVLQQILDEEGRTDKLLTQIAENHVNIAADEMGMQGGQVMSGSSSAASNASSRSGGSRQSK
jgi:ferritin-like metal-binding protein YciE